MNFEKQLLEHNPDKYLENMLRIQSTQKAHNARILASNYSMKDEESELLGNGMEIKISENQVKDSAYIDRRARSQIP